MQLGKENGILPGHVLLSIRIDLNGAQQPWKAFITLQKVVTRTLF